MTGGTAERLQKLRARMTQSGWEALLVTNRYNRRYLTGFTGTSGYVVITGKRAVLLTDFRYTEQAAREAAFYEIVEHGRDVNAAIRQILRDENIGRLAFEKNDITYGAYQSLSADLQGVELVPADMAVEELRMVKDEQELAAVKEAARIADMAYNHILQYIKPGVSEREIALELETFMRKQGASGASFDTIVASGPRSALPHGVASEKKIGKNEFVTLDFGAVYRGYCSDLTRTVFVGKPSDKDRMLYEMVLEAQTRGVEHIRAGMTGHEADALTRNILKGYGYDGYFGHGTGHGLGLEIHEAPRLSLHADTVLQPGMTVTVEPGIYLPGYGGVRIEDDVVITAEGAERLTLSAKQFTIVD